MHDLDKRPSRLAALPLAVAFLFETWLWEKLVAFARMLSTWIPWQRYRDAARRVVDRAPAIFAILLFGVPLFVSEFGAFISVVLMATGHLFLGMALYVAMKIFGLFLVPVIFEITREKLLALPWFAYGYAMFERLHEMVRRFVAPYREAAKDWVRDYWSSLLALFQRNSRSAANASAAKAETLASSARAVGSSPASPSH